GLRDGQRDRITQLLALEELCARGRRDGAGEGDEGEAGCGHGSGLLVARVFAVPVTASGKAYPARTACTLRATPCAILSPPGGARVVPPKARRTASSSNETP